MSRCKALTAVEQKAATERLAGRKRAIRGPYNLHDGVTERHLRDLLRLTDHVATRLPGADLAIGTRRHADMMAVILAWHKDLPLCAVPRSVHERLASEAYGWRKRTRRRQTCYGQDGRRR